LSERIAISELVLDDRCQVRKNFSKSRAKMFRDIYRSLEQMEKNGSKQDDPRVIYPGCKEPPAVRVVKVGDKSYLVDGFHRVAGAIMARRGFIRYEIIENATDVDRARWLALKQNRNHGLPLSNKDKARAVRLALENGIGGEQSTRCLAEHLGIDHKTVKKHRDRWEAEQKAGCEPGTAALGKLPKAPPDRVMTKDGRSYPKRRKAAMKEQDELVAATEAAQRTDGIGRDNVARASVSLELEAEQLRDVLDVLNAGHKRLDRDQGILELRLGADHALCCTHRELLSTHRMLLDQVSGLGELQP
jgi:transposase-like protein